jgi:PKD repeat protein
MMLMIASKDGLVHVMEDPDNSSDVIQILDIGDENMCSNGERGVQSIVAHPDFGHTNFWVYIFYTKFREGCSEGPDDGPWNVVERLEMDAQTLELDYTSRVEIWRGAPLHEEMHNGGAMAFGVADGKLYVTHGDSGNDQMVQPLDNTLGSIMRLNDDGGIPDDNPYTTANGYVHSYRCADSGGIVPIDAPTDGTAVCAEVYANGLRNPFRISMNTEVTDKVLFALSDVGGSYWEELTYGGTDYAGRNYGYPEYESVCYHGTEDDCPVPVDTNYLEPFHWYQHRSTKEGGCIAASVFVPESVGWPSKYKVLFIDFIFLEMYKLIEDPDNECRTCVPPRSGYLNETFYESILDPDKHVDSARMTDMLFGPYGEDGQALYFMTKGVGNTVNRIRYTGSKNEPPVPKIYVNPTEVGVGETTFFDGSFSSDPEDEIESFVWDFGDGEQSTRKKPQHTYNDPGQYGVTLVVTDTEGQSQQASVTVVVGSPPTAKILSPTDGEEFYVGQIFQLVGEAFDRNDEPLDDTQLSWEVRKYHADHFHPFMEPTVGNSLALYPAPAPEDFFASTNSYLLILLTVTDSDGLTTLVERTIEPAKIIVEIDSNPQGLEILVDNYPVTTSDQITSWKDHELSLVAIDQGSYAFVSWEDGSTGREHRVILSELNPTVQANFCLQGGGSCTDDTECCSFLCNKNGTCHGNATSFTNETSAPIGCLANGPLCDQQPAVGCLLNGPLCDQKHPVECVADGRLCKHSDECCNKMICTGVCYSFAPEASNDEGFSLTAARSQGQGRRLLSVSSTMMYAGVVMGGSILVLLMWTISSACKSIYRQKHDILDNDYKNVCTSADEGVDSSWDAAVL